MKLILLWASLLLAGCSLADKPLVAAIVGQTADVAMTHYYVCYDDYVESNPLMNRGNCWGTTASLVIGKGLLIGGLWLVCKPEECPGAFKALGVVGIAATAASARAVAKDKNEP